MRNAIAAWGLLLAACGTGDVGPRPSLDGGDDSGTRGNASCPLGAETCHCTAQGTCNAAIVCASNLCVNVGGLGQGGSGSPTGSGGRRGVRDGGAGGTLGRRDSSTAGS